MRALKNRINKKNTRGGKKKYGVSNVDMMLEDDRIYLQELRGVFFYQFQELNF